MNMLAHLRMHFLLSGKLVFVEVVDARIPMLHFLLRLRE